MGLRARIASASIDAELRRLGAGLVAVLRIEGASDDILLRLDGGAVVFEGNATPDIVLTAAEGDWAKLLVVPPPPRFQAFTALAIANPAFTLSGDPLLIAQARAVIERLFELVVLSPVAQASSVERRMSQIEGRYHRVALPEGTAEIHVETPGSGRPILLLHTAGADGRQFHAQRADVAPCRPSLQPAPTSGASASGHAAAPVGGGASGGALQPCAASRTTPIAAYSRSGVGVLKLHMASNMDAWNAANSALSMMSP